MSLRTQGTGRGGHARSASRSVAGRGKPKRRRRHFGPWLWSSLAALIVVLAGAAALGWFDGPQPQGTLEADQLRQELGQIRMGGGVSVTQFPLTVQGDALVTRMGTT